MTKERFIIDDDGIVTDMVDLSMYIDNEDCCEKLNELNDENQQLRKFIMDLQNMIQFDVDNGIKTYPKTLSEYLANVLKVMLND